MKKLLLIMLLIPLILSGCGKAAQTTNPLAGMYTGSVEQGFEFFPWRQWPIGYITYLKLGGVEYTADLQVTDPLNQPNKINVFGVISQLMWKGATTDSIVFSAQVSTNNQKMLAATENADFSKMDVDFSFVIYQFDTKANKYFKRISSGTQALQGMVHKEGEYYLYLISTDLGAEVNPPDNYTFQLGVEPKGVTQEIEIGTSAKDSTVKPWGAGK
jgi:uncharacterized protein YceK